MAEIPGRVEKGVRSEWMELAGNASDPRTGHIERTWGSVEKTAPTKGYGAGQHMDESTMEIAEKDQDEGSPTTRMMIERPAQEATFSRGTYGNSRRTPSR